MRRKSEWNRRLAGVILLLALSVGLGTVWGASPAVQEILAKGRGANSQEATDLSKRLVALGPEALSEVCVMLLAPGTGDDVNARFALSGATMYVSRTGAETERKMLEGVLLDALKKASNSDVKAFLIERLRFIAKDESVPALAAYLTDETLCDWSARTLVTINSDASRAALVAALPNAKGSCQMRVAQALGNLREAKALDTLSDLAKNNDKAIRKAALYALAQIADLKSEPVLMQAMADAQGFEQSELRGYYFEYLSNLAASKGEKQKKSAEICRQIIKSHTDPKHAPVQCAALSVLVKAEGEGAMADLTQASENPSKEVRQAALALVQGLPGKAVTETWAARAEKAATPEQQTEILAMLAARGDQAALPVAEKLTHHADASVRLAAVDAILVLKAEAGQATLLEMLKTATPEETPALARRLALLPGDAPMVAIAAALPTLPPATQTALAGVLGQRNATAQSGAVLELVKSNDPAVRTAALEALTPIADPKDLGTLVKCLTQASENKEETVARKAVVTTANRIADKEQRATTVLEALKNADKPAHAKLVTALAGIGGAEALKAVAADAKSDDATVREVAIRALSKWVDGSAAEALFSVAQSTPEMNLHVVALKAYIEMLGKSSVSDAEKVKGLGQALNAAKRPDEKKLAIGQLAKVRTVESLQLVTKSLDDAAFQAEAAAAVIQIVCPAEGEPLKGDEALKALQKAVKLVKNPDEAKRATSALEEVEGFVTLFNGKDMTGWVGNTKGYVAEDGRIVVHPELQGGNLYTEKEYSDFVFRFEFKLTPGANNGVGIRAPLEGDAAYGAMELQIIDNTAEQYKNLQPYQYHGSIYGIVPAKREFLKPVGEWNSEEVIAKGNQITVILNGETIVDADIKEATKNGTADHRDHPGLFNKSGHIGFLGHGDPLEFRNIRVKELPAASEKTETPAAGPLNTPPDGFVALFNGKDLTGWKGLARPPLDNPINRAKAKPEEMKAAQEKANEEMKKNWTVTDKGELFFDGKGFSLATVREDYGDFEMLVDWKIAPEGDSGIYLRGTPQVQIWDPNQHKIGSGGLYNNEKNPKDPTEIADKPAGEWNSFRIKMVGDKVTVFLNGKLVVDKVTMENYWDRNQPIFPTGQLELQCHGNPVYFRNIYLRELPRGK
ncbi:MAG TPA: DUF1080 domain-containing protein [Candidatus Sumerlaeota bacterium]|mgnify:CR=1 FL=1|nr:DUF1080 domain-containing protein [Candidatus Sumerlaeota bacterium]